MIKLLLSLAFALAGATTLASEVSIRLDNYSKYPVYATAVSFDHRDLCAKLGVGEGTPISLLSAEGNQPILVLPGHDNGRAVVRAMVTLPPRGGCKLRARAATKWMPREGILKAAYDSVTGYGVLRNGVIAVRVDKEGWTMSFDSPGSNELMPGRELMRNATLDCWLDTRNRGRMLYVEPSEAGLMPVSKGRLKEAQASVTEEGGCRLRLVKAFEPPLDQVTLTETLELLPGSPVMTYSARWDNQGGEPRWVAYTKFGGGLKGDWGELISGSILQKSNSPVGGFLLPSSIDLLRPSWMKKVCRVGFESETGVGLASSTLSRVANATGSMVWIFSNRTFQFNLLEPRQGQFPFAINKGQPVEAGFAFAATQTGVNVFPQADELWEKFTTGKTPRLPSPCSVYLDGEAVSAQEADGLGASNPAEWVSKAGVARAALQLDLANPYVCEIDVVKVSPQAPVEIYAVPLGSAGGEVLLGRASEPGRLKFDLNKALGWNTSRALELQLSLPEGASVRSVTVAELPARSPDLLSPVPNAQITDIGAMFRWTGIPKVIDYEFQISKTPDFAGARSIPVRKSNPYPCYLPGDDELPGPGAWNWRVRGVKSGVAGQWSETRKITVNNERGIRPMKRPLRADRPLFTVEATRVRDFESFKPSFPTDLSEYLGIVVEGYVDRGLTISRFMRGLEKLPNPILMRGFGPGAPVDTWATLADWEWAFQNIPNFVGVQGGESLSWFYEDEGAIRYTHRLLRLCQKYGMLYHEADGTYEHDKWQSLMDKQGDFIRKYGGNLILSQKNNIIRRQYLSESACIGLWLGGSIYHHGAWEDGGFYWQNAGFGELGTCMGERKGVLKTMPRIFWDLMIIKGLSHGSGIYSLDGQTLMVSSGDKNVADQPRGFLWNEKGETSETFNRFIIPLIRGIVQHRLVPSKEEVIGNTRLAVYNDRVKGDSRRWPYYVEYGPLFAATYGFGEMSGFDGQLWEFFPNTGRYFYIPILPQGNVSIAPNVKNLALSSLQDVRKVKELFDAAYPPRSAGEALVTRVGDTLTVLNTNENQDVTETYSVPVNAGAIGTLSGKIGPHAYLVGKIKDNEGVWLQANSEYTGRETELAIACKRKPKWQIEPRAAAQLAEWDPASQQLKIRVSHDSGAVEIQCQTSE